MPAAPILSKLVPSNTNSLATVSYSRPVNVVVGSTVSTAKFLTPEFTPLISAVTVSPSSPMFVTSAAVTANDQSPKGSTTTVFVPAKVIPLLNVRVTSSPTLPRPVILKPALSSLFTLSSVAIALIVIPTESASFDKNV